MNKLFKGSIAFLMALVICIGLASYVKIPTDAATVDYVYSGSYIKNWGVREEIATFLSPNAEAFYTKNNVTYEQLSALDGSSTISSVPSSQLYTKLKDLMTKNHKKVTSYNDTRPLFQYTDCQDSGKTSTKISSFYSGKDIGPAWDSGKTWNREHVWPNSKGDLSGNGENDIMMLRPTATSENGSRGNKAYGTTSSYYNPNSESGNKYDLRGDVSRIILYQYVRWGCINTGSGYNSKDIFGTKGVIESLDVLLLWIEEDPVDTWELGRNDSVESITGTRNVFVDYPELAFILFGEDVPAGYISPSGSGAATAPVITATANNNFWGTVNVNGNVITATPASGYTVYGYTIVSGNATLSKNGNTFTVDAKSDVTIKVNFAPITTYAISFYENGSKANTKTVADGELLSLPAHKGSLEKGNSFVGWVEKTTGETSKAPTYHKANTNFTPQGNTTLYALYSYTDGTKTVYSTSFIKASEPEVSTPEVSEPETSIPEVSEPETSTPEVSEPETSTPEVSIPEVSEPETSTPEVSTPDESVPDVSENNTSEPLESSDEIADVSGENSSSSEESKNTVSDTVSQNEVSGDKNNNGTNHIWWIILAVVIAAGVTVIIIIIVKNKNNK